MDSLILFFPLTHLALHYFFSLGKDLFAVERLNRKGIVVIFFDAEK